MVATSVCSGVCFAGRNSCSSRITKSPPLSMLELILLFSVIIQHLSLEVARNSFEDRRVFIPAFVKNNLPSKLVTRRG